MDNIVQKSDRIHNQNEQMAWLQLESVLDVSMNLSLKFGQNWVTNNLYIPDMDKWHQE